VENFVVRSREHGPTEMSASPIARAKPAAELILEL
jgi:hypothetical protein